MTRSLELQPQDYFENIVEIAEDSGGVGVLLENPLSSFGYFLVERGGGSGSAKGKPEAWEWRKIDGKDKMWHPIKRRWMTREEIKAIENLYDDDKYESYRR